MFWRREKKETAPPTQTVEQPDPTPRVMSADEIAIHVVEAMRAGPRYWLTRDMEGVARAWWTENHVEPIQMCHLREAVQTTPGVKYAKLHLRGPKFGPIRRALAERGMGTVQQYVYDVQDQATASLRPGYEQVHSGYAQFRTGHTRSDFDVDRKKTRAA